MDNFYDTAQRMQKSSEILHNNGDYHNACYLAGYVIECYAKIIVGVSGAGTPKSFRHDLVKLNLELQNVLGGNSSFSSYILNGSSDFSNILNNWNPVDLRYVDNASAIYSIILSSDFQAEIQLAMQQLANMRNNGIQLI